MSIDNIFYRNDKIGFIEVYNHKTENFKPYFIPPMYEIMRKIKARYNYERNRTI